MGEMPTSRTPSSTMRRVRRVRRGDGVAISHLKVVSDVEAVAGKPVDVVSLENGGLVRACGGTRGAARAGTGRVRVVPSRWNSARGWRKHNGTAMAAETRRE